MKQLKLTLLTTSLFSLFFASQLAFASMDNSTSAYQLQLANGQSVKVLVIEKINVNSHDIQEQNLSDVEAIYLNGE